MLQISDEEFNEISQIMYKKTGVLLRPTKKPLVVSRLRKRLAELNYDGFQKYIRLLESANDSELEYFINAITTNETFFFRHSMQFNFLYEQMLPELISNGKKHVQVWSAASSTGEEPYSLAITLNEFFKDKAGKDFTIFASDVNTTVLSQAQKGHFGSRSLKEVPPSLKSRYFKVSAEEQRSQSIYTVTDDLKRKIKFFQHNLKHNSDKKDIDIIFLRNVLIYFDKDTKQQVVSLLEKTLKPNGYFAISLSENLNDISTSLKLIKSGIFQKQ